MNLVVRYKVVIVLIILVIGFLLRGYHLTAFPPRGATFDEFAWTWLGINILQKGIPISWSPHSQYKLREHYVDQYGTTFWLVQPYLEHPPLFGLLSGGWALLNGAKDMFTVELFYIRSLSLLLGVLSIFLVFLLSKEIYGDLVGLLSALFYATTPTVVIGSRLVQNENFFIPLYLFVVLLTVRYVKRKKYKILAFNANGTYILPAIICGLLTLAKVPWWGAALSCIFLLCSVKKYRQAVVFFGIVTAFFSLFFLWGMYWDKAVFFDLLKLQTARYDITFDGIFALFTTPFLANELYIDGWIYVGWFALLILLSKFKDHRFLLLGFFGYFVVYILGIPNEPGHGWYRYPFYPFLIIALSYVLVESIKERSLLTFFSLSFIGLPLLKHVWEILFGFSFYIYRVFLVCCGIPSVMSIFPEKRFQIISTYSSVLLVFLLCLLNIFAVVLYR